MRSKLEQIDGMGVPLFDHPFDADRSADSGNALVIGSTIAIVIGMTWRGVEYAWTSARVLVPLIVGGVRLVLLLYKALWARNPLVPVSLILNRTGISGFIQTGVLSIPLTGLMYNLPVYYQACMLASPIRAGTLAFGVAFTVAPTTIVAGALITATKRYRPPIGFGWALLLASQGLLTTLTATSSKATSIDFEILTGVGIGAVYSSTYFPVLAPLPVEQNAPALALYVFLRSFAQIWGVANGATVLQNQLSSRLPEKFFEALSSGASVAYSAIPAIPAFVPVSPEREEVQAAFAGRLDVL